MLHSALSERERYDAWQAAARGELDVIVGARSAVFAPLPGVQMIVVDEEHESSYRQDSTPRYHAVDVARERMRRAGGVLVLGSATPALEDYARAKAGRFPARAVARTRDRAAAAGQRTSSTWRANFEAGSNRIFSTRAGGRDRRTARARREERAVRQPARRRAVRAVPLVRLRAELRALFHLARRCIATKGGCAATTAMRSSRFPRSVRRAASVRSRRTASARSALQPKWRRSFRPRASCAWTPTRRRASAITRGCSIASRAKPTCSSARRWSRRDSIFRK